MVNTLKKSICIFCGASTGEGDAYIELARSFGALLALQKRTLVYGGGNRGLMGVLATSAMAHGGEVIGVIPERLVVAETAHQGVTRLEVVQTMHERKARMAELSDAFVSLPGGIGTLEEFFEMWTGMQLGYHGKPLALLNAQQFWSPLVDFLQHMMRAGFVRQAFLDTLLLSDDGEDLLRRIDAFSPQDSNHWLKNKLG
jgi:uncharacterized protein (TIGR00730 family)